MEYEKKQQQIAGEEAAKDNVRLLGGGRSFLNEWQQEISQNVQRRLQSGPGRWYFYSAMGKKMPKRRGSDRERNTG